VYGTPLALPLLSRSSPASLPLLSRFSPGSLPPRPGEATKDLSVVRTRTRQICFMPMNKKELDAFRRTIFSGPYKSPLFWWLVERYDELIADGASNRQNWKRHCETMARDGVVDAKGKPPNAEAARKAWQVVRKEVAAGRVKWPFTREPPPRETAVAPHRSRRSSDWQPDIRPSVSQPPLVSAPVRQQEPSREPPQMPIQGASPISASVNPAKSKLDNLPPDVKAKFDKLRQSFAETDRKRFGTF
jgi:hypothetical protein